MRSFAMVSVRYAVLAVVLLVSTNVYGAAVENETPGQNAVPEGGEASTSYGEGNFINFRIKNGDSLTETGKIMNSVLSWGKWQQDGIDVASVNNIEFTKDKAAVFTALGRAHSPSGTDGRFDIYQNGKKVAVVEFVVPYIGKNTFHIEYVDKSYICGHSGFDSSGSPSIEMTCYKLAHAPVASTSYGEGNFMNFRVKNGANVKETGSIVNAALTWGKWQRNGEDVDSVNNIEFNSTQSAEFTASGRAHSPSGTEGSFEIHEGGKSIATVEFSVPYVSSNYFHVKYTDKNYICTHFGFDSSGSPSVELTCHKIK